MANNKTFVQNNSFTVADSNTEAFGSSVAGTEIVKILATNNPVYIDQRRYSGDSNSKYAQAELLRQSFVFRA